MGFKDKLKEAQGNQARIPRITTVRNLEIKENEKGQVAFACWDKENEKMVYANGEISGILIGKCMVASVYDDQLGVKGGTYRSSYYLTNNDEMVLFDNKGKVAKKGTIEDIVVFASNCTGNVSKKQVLFVHTDEGLFGITTNLTLSIGRFSAIDKANKDIFMDNQVVLTPTVYNPDDESINSQTKSYLGKFAAKNPPKYTEVSIGEPINEEMEGIEESIEMFLEWKKYMATVTKLPAIEEMQDGSGQPSNLGNSINPDDVDVGSEMKKAPFGVKKEEEQEEDTGLPF